MHISSKELMHIPVKTQSDVFLGYVIGFDMDVLQHMVMRYYVKKGVFTTPLTHSLDSAEYIIHQSQVLSITKERILVEDALVREKEIKKVKRSAVLPSEGRIAPSPGT